LPGAQNVRKKKMASGKRQTKGGKARRAMLDGGKKKKGPENFSELLGRARS